MSGPDQDRTVELLTQLAADVAASAGLEVVSLKIAGGKRGRVVRLDLDRAGPVGLNLADCEAMSAALGIAIEEAALFDSPYALEVSSPGIDRPIRSDDDVRRNTGRRVLIETSVPLAGRTRFLGILAGVSGSNWIVRGDDGTEWAVPADQVIQARQDCRF